MISWMRKSVSDQIDDELRRDRTRRNKRTDRKVKVLLLGQSESGKSTVLKNFRLEYEPLQWKAELRSWRAIIQLNLIQNVLTILDVMEARLAVPEAPPSYGPTGFIPQAYDGRASIDSTLSDITLVNSWCSAMNIVLTQKHRVLNLRLSPLREVEDDLRRRLEAVDPEFTFAQADDGAMNGVAGDGHRQAVHEFRVREWTVALGFPSSGAKKADEPMAVDEPTEVLATVRDDIISLWEDVEVRKLLRAKGIHIEDQPGFFLSDTARITTRTYVPSDNDVVRARRRTLGVQEWRIMLSNNSDSFDPEWVIYDVGGSHSMCHAWLPYFTAVNAIIFLAPISCFDECLAEDSSVNRLEHTLLLWKAIVSSKLLTRTTLIVFLNKCDLLKRCDLFFLLPSFTTIHPPKLQSGIMVNKHITSFGNRENEVGVVVEYLKGKFKDILRWHGWERRTAYLYATSLTDTKATAATLNIGISVVRDGIIRDHLKNLNLL
ncbi:guanine nucleotide binding protein, alpha subunit [Mycena epipterygia]|nr:guanine nucleotide binding protein, alpha subunit [Mycena epipterygia]